MEVSQPQFELRKAVDALTNARTLIHTFQVKPVADAVGRGPEGRRRCPGRRPTCALQEHTARRIWLAISLVPIFLVIVLLVAYIRSLPLPKQESH